MNGYDVGAGAVAAVVAITAAWTTWLSPWAKQRRQATRQQLDFHRDWNGEDPRPGVPRRHGVMERIEQIEQRLQAPILNGSGNRMIDTVDTIGGDVAELKGQVASFEAKLHEMDERIENRFTEQVSFLTDMTIGSQADPTDQS